MGDRRRAGRTADGSDVESLEKIKFALVEMKENAGVDVATVDQSYKEYKVGTDEGQGNDPARR